MKRQPRDVLQRLLEKIPPGEGCREFTGAKNQAGYGEFQVSRGVKRQAHRILWILVNGPIPDGLLVCHTCDNPPCCNLDHLFLGTTRDNALDAKAKGRLRGNTVNSGQINRSKTHCPKGHPYSEDNVAHPKRSDGYVGRRCKTCHRLQESKRYRSQHPLVYVAPPKPRCIDCGCVLTNRGTQRCMSCRTAYRRAMASKPKPPQPKAAQAK